MTGSTGLMPGFLAETLTWEENRHYVAILKTARSWGVPPLTMLTGSDEGWTFENRVLAQALTTLEDETCKGCGVPVWHSRSSHRNINLLVEKDTCYGCKASEEERKKAETNKKSSNTGEKSWVKAVPYDEVAGLPTRFESYKREADRQERLRKK